MFERVALMIVYDDNDSLRKEEILGVSRFEGAAVGTKTSGPKQQVWTSSLYILWLASCLLVSLSKKKPRNVCLCCQELLLHNAYLT